MINKRYIDKHPMKGTKKLNKEYSCNFTPWSNSEISEFLKVAYIEGEGEMFEFELLTGLRLGELLALSWEDIDFEKQKVTVGKNPSPGGKEKGHIGKISRGWQTINLSPYLLTLLKKHKETQELIKEGFGGQYQNELDLVFPKSNGGRQNTLTIRAKFNRLIDKANVRKISFHGLRKMHILFLYQAGVSFETLSPVRKNESQF